MSLWLDPPMEGRSVLTLLGTEGRKLDIGDQVSGALSASDYMGLNGSYLEAWSLKADAGQTLSIDLISDDFDSYLYVVGPGLDQPLQDDDQGGACHASLDFTVLDAGTFHIVASSSGQQTGTYQLRVSDQPTPPVGISCGGIDGMALTALPTAGRELTIGGTGHGQLGAAEASIENDRPVQAWTMRGEAGESVTIRHLSEDFDSYLYVFGPGLAETLTDDDGAGDLDSEITITFRESGTYTIGAGALSSGSTGFYTLTATRPVTLNDLPTAERELWVTSDAYGTLTDSDERVEGRLVQAWAFQARAGQSVTIDQHSEAFDSYLQVVGPGFREAITNDDGGDGLDSRLQVTFPETGTYRIIASSLGGTAGSYTLQIR